MELIRLKVNSQYRPCVDEAPYFSWVITSDEKNVMQTSYHITVKNMDEVMWDSGMVESDKSIFVEYSGKPLQSLSDYNWTVEVTVNNGEKAAADTESFTFDNCSYVYFGGFNRKSNPKLPLVIDWPFNHADAVNVILVDGSVETLELENPENCRRVVSYLHTRYHYTEPEFKQLMQKAAALDQQFELD